MNNAASLLEWSKHFSIFDSTPLNGLRGFVALHILLFHSIQDVTLVNIYGDVNLLNHLPMKVSIKKIHTCVIGQSHHCANFLVQDLFKFFLLLGPSCPLLKKRSCNYRIEFRLACKYDFFSIQTLQTTSTVEKLDPPHLSFFLL